MEDLQNVLEHENLENKETFDVQNIESIENTDDLNIQEEVLDSVPEELKNSLEAPDEAPNESIDIQAEDANTTNCLALTIQKEHKLVAVKNVFIRSIRMTWKVAISAITLAIIKLFS